MRWLLVVFVALGTLGWGSSVVLAEKRVALVVGNSAYQSTTPLANPLNDARDMAAELKMDPLEFFLKNLALTGTRVYDVTPDGKRFLMTEDKARPPLKVTEMILVQNWFEELTRRVPTK